MTLPRFDGLYGIAGPAGPGAPRERHDGTLAVARALLAAGVRVLQLRDKQADGRELVSTARELVGLAHAAGAWCVVNDRLDVALAAGADGVHLGQDDLAVEDVRRVLAAAGRAREGFVVGLSTHDLAQVARARALDVDYLGFGPVHATRSKADALAPRGCGALGEAVRVAAGRPVVAIGGLGLDTVADAARAGAAMVAVISDIQRAADPAARARAVQERFRAARAGGGA